MPIIHHKTAPSIGGFRFRHSTSFSASLPRILQSECAIISADRAGFTFEENAHRTEDLRTRLFDAFLRGNHSLVFDLSPAKGSGLSSRERLCRYLFVAERPASKGKPSESPFLERLARLAYLFQKRSFIFIPAHHASDNVAAEELLLEGTNDQRMVNRRKLGNVCFLEGREQIEIGGREKRLIFEVRGQSPIVTGSMTNAYLFRELMRQRRPGLGWVA